MAKGIKTGGRKKGSRNKSVCREKIQDFLLANFDEMQVLFKEVREKSPTKALEIYISLLEFDVARLARVQTEGEVDNNITIKWL